MSDNKKSIKKKASEDAELNKEDLKASLVSDETKEKLNNITEKDNNSENSNDEIIIEDTTEEETTKKENNNNSGVTIDKNINKPKMVKIKTKVNHKCTIGGVPYRFVAGVIETVPQEVKDILNRAGLLGTI